MRKKTSKLIPVVTSFQASPIYPFES